MNTSNANRRSVLQDLIEEEEREEEARNSTQEAILACAFEKGKDEEAATNKRQMEAGQQMK